MLDAIQQAGPIAWIIFVLGAIGGVASVAALITTRARGKDAARLGAVLMAFAIACAGLGAAGVVTGRRATDRVMRIEGEDLGPIRREQMKREGYERARGVALLGLLAAALPLLAGATAMLVRRPKSEEEALVDAMVEPWPTPRARALSITAGVLSAGVALVAFSARLPGRALKLDATAWDVLDAVHFIQRGESRSELLWGCRKLEEALPDGAAAPRTVDARTLRAADRTCVEERIQEAAVQSEVRSIREALERLYRSSFVKRDPELARPVEVALNEVRILETSPPSMDPEVVVR